MIVTYEEYVEKMEELAQKVVRLSDDYPASVRFGALVRVIATGIVAVNDGDIGAECQNVGAIIMDLSSQVKEIHGANYRDAEEGELEA